MPRYAAFLRGVNLGPRRRAGSTELRALFEELGFKEVSPFRTSGNVVFEAGREPGTKLTKRIERGLADSLGFDVAVFLRTAAEIGTIAGHEPFPPKATAASKGKLQVVLLGTRPAAKTKKDVLALATDEDRLAFGDRELYWLPNGGTRDSGLDLKTIEKLLGSTTMRTKGTLEQMAAKYFGG